jgi:hypothetical protein
VNVTTGAVGIAFKDDVDIRRNAEQSAELLREHLSPKISQRKLEATVAVVEEHFDSNEVIWAWM